MTTSTSQPLDTRRVWLVTVVSIVAIVAVNYVVSGPTHGSSPIALRLVAAAIVTVFVVLAKLLGGPRGAAVTGVLGVLIAVVLLDQVS